MALLDLFIAAIGETLTMVSASAVIVLFIGLPLAVLLVTTAPGGIYEAARLNRVLGAVINMFRSTPFIILMVALIPFTRLVVGTTIGVWAAAVPLTVASAPFFARVSEVSLRSVDQRNEVREPAGQRRRHDVVAVGTVVQEALFELVHDPFGRAHQLPVAARTGHALVELANRQVLAPRQVDHQLASGWRQAAMWWPLG